MAEISGVRYAVRTVNKMAKLPGGMAQEAKETVKIERKEEIRGARDDNARCHLILNILAYFESFMHEICRAAIKNTPGKKNYLLLYLCDIRCLLFHQ